MNTIINHKRYSVSRKLNDMEYNFLFTDKDNITYLVDGFNVQEWADEYGYDFIGIESAIEYAKEMSNECDGVFYWKISN